MLNWSRAVSRIAGLVKHTPRTTHKSARQLSALRIHPLSATRTIEPRTRSIPSRPSSPTCLYHTRAHVKYADIAARDAESSAQSGSAVQPLLERAYSLLAVAELDGDTAAESAREAVELFTQSLTHELSKEEQASCLDALAVCHLKLGDVAAAERAVRRGMATDAEWAPLWLHWGEVLQHYGQHVQAASAFTKFVELSKAHYHTTAAQWDAEADAASYRYTPRTAHTDTVGLLCAAFFKRAVSYIRVQEETMALSDLWLIVDTAHSPQWTARAYLAIAQLARLRGDWHQARTLATKALDAAKQDATHTRQRAQLLSQAHHLRAVCYEALDDEPRAEQDHVLADFYFRETAYKAQS